MEADSTENPSVALGYRREQRNGWVAGSDSGIENSFFKIYKLTMLFANKNDIIQNKRPDDIGEKEEDWGVMFLGRCEEMGSTAQIEGWLWIIHQ